MAKTEDPFDTGKPGVFQIDDRLVDSFGNTVGGAESDDEEEVETGYESWNVKQLRAEIENRNSEREDEETHISAAGKKADLIAALAADDETADDEEE
jgi:hypothetical protein